MKKRSINLRNRLLLFTAVTVVSGGTGNLSAHAQSETSQVVIPGEGTSSDLNAYQIEKVKILYKKLLLKEKDIPNAISHITQAQIAQAGIQGSIQSVLRQTPSVNEYQSAPGQGVPVITIRGVRYAELSATLDGTPMTDILQGGQGGFLNNNIGSPITLQQISGSTVYPGLAPPPDQGFGSAGGTIAYQTLDPEKTKSARLFGSYGSFNTSDAGFELNTGSITGEPDGPRAVLQYDQGYTDGFIDDTNERNQDMIFKVVKPYDGGLSNITGTVIYNRGFGYINTAPLPTNLLTSLSRSYNFPKSTAFTSQNNTYLTAILSDTTYINPHLIVGGTLYYNHTESDSLNYENPTTIPYNVAFPYQVTFQVPYFAYGAFGSTADAQGLAGSNTNGFTYDPFSAAPKGSDPTNPLNYVYGESAELIQTHSYTVGFQPKANIFLPYNNIVVGALIAKEASGGAAFVGSSPDVPQDVGYNAYSYGGGSQRTVYQAYLQDKIDLLQNRLHLQPGVTIASAYSSNISQFSLYAQPAKIKGFNVIAEPYLGVSFDFPYHVTAYGNYGKGATFAPLTDYAPLQDAFGNVIGSHSPQPEIIHLYEGGLRYDTSRLYINADIYYQKITDADSFFENYQTGQFTYGNDGNQEFKGEEVATQFQATPELAIFGNASYNKATYLNNYFADDTPFEDQYGYVFKGDPLASVPRWLSDFGFDFEHGNFGARLEEEYTGQQYVTYDFPPQLTYTGPNITNNPLCSQGGFPHVPNACLNLATVPAYSNPLKELISGIVVPSLKQRAFLISNILLHYDIPVSGRVIQNLHLELNIHNLLNENYYSHLYSSYAELPVGGGGFQLTSAYNSAFIGSPRSITVSLSAKF